MRDGDLLFFFSSFKDKNDKDTTIKLSFSLCNPSKDIISENKTIWEGKVTFPLAGNILISPRGENSSLTLSDILGIISLRNFDSFTKETKEANQQKKLGSLVVDSMLVHWPQKHLTFSLLNWLNSDLHTRFDTLEETKLPAKALEFFKLVSTTKKKFTLEGCTLKGDTKTLETLQETEGSIPKGFNLGLVMDFKDPDAKSFRLKVTFTPEYTTSPEENINGTNYLYLLSYTSSSSVFFAEHLMKEGSFSVPTFLRTLWRPKYKGMLKICDGSTDIGLFKIHSMEFMCKGEIFQLTQEASVNSTDLKPQDKDLKGFRFCFYPKLDVYDFLIEEILKRPSQDVLKGLTMLFTNAVNFPC